MVKFEPISLEKQDLYHKYFSITPIQSADYTFINLYGLSSIYSLEWAFTDDLVWIRQNSPDIVYWAPVGNWYQYNFNKNNVPFEINKDNIIRIPTELALHLEKNIGLKIKEDRDEWEYLYDFNQLSTLSGRKFHNKKNLFNQFMKNDFVYKPIDSSMINDIFEFESRWEISEIENSVSSMESEYYDENREVFDSYKLILHEIRAEADILMIKMLLDSWDKINFISGGVIYIDNKIVAYSIGDLSMRDTIVVHSERGDRNYKGSYQAINRLFLENNKDERFKFVNREQDVGDLGLRKAKLSYNPVGYIEKYKNDI